MFWVSPAAGQGGSWRKDVCQRRSFGAPLKATVVVRLSVRSQRVCVCCHRAAFNRHLNFVQQLLPAHQNGKKAEFMCCLWGCFSTLVVFGPDGLLITAASDRVKMKNKDIYSQCLQNNKQINNQTLFVRVVLVKECWNKRGKMMWARLDGRCLLG